MLKTMLVATLSRETFRDLEQMKVRIQKQTQDRIQNRHL